MEKQRLENMDAEEQADLLKKMFSEVGVSLTWKFDDALRNVRQDHRFKFLRMSMATKKQIFHEYRDDVRAEERKQANFKR